MGLKELSILECFSSHNSSAKLIRGIFSISTAFTNICLYLQYIFKTNRKPCGTLDSLSMHIGDKEWLKTLFTSLMNFKNCYGSDDCKKQITNTFPPSHQSTCSFPEWALPVIEYIFSDGAICLFLTCWLKKIINILQVTLPFRFVCVI